MSRREIILLASATASERQSARNKYDGLTTALINLCTRVMRKEIWRDPVGLDGQAEFIWPPQPDAHLPAANFKTDMNGRRILDTIRAPYDNGLVRARIITGFNNLTAPEDGTHVYLDLSPGEQRALRTPKDQGMAVLTAIDAAFRR